MDYLIELNKARKTVDEIAVKLNKPMLVGKISVDFNTAFRSCAGKAYWRPVAGNHKIRLSAKIWPYMTEQQRYETVVHEVCHIIANINFARNCKHDWRWRLTMRNAGVKPERCHNIPIYELGISKRRGRRERVVGKCGCVNGCQVGPTVAKRMREKNMAYRCVRCKQKISL
jgi:predicted SprT family Zn-dependent metalloprotease